MGLRISLCGRLEVELGGERIERRLRGRQGPLVLAVLVLNRARPVARDELIGALWPGEAPADPDEALSAVLSKVRQAIGRDTLTGRRELTLVLPADAEVDVEQAFAAAERARSAIARGDWPTAWAAASTAVEITGRGFLVGHDAPWVEDRRGELEELRLRALEAVAEAGVALGGEHVAGAERAARELTRVAPLREAGHRLVMEALAARGEVPEALAAYEDLRVLLREELGTAPGAAVRALHERLLAGEPDRSVPVPTLATVEPVPLPALLSRTRGALVGREQELVGLRQAWADARSGRRQLVLLCGGPGIGKTRLAGELAREVHTDGTVLYGGCQEDALVSYQPFVEALRHYVRNASLDGALSRLGSGGAELARLIPELAEEMPQGDGVPADDAETRRYLMFEAVSALLTEACDRAPVLLVLDDLHWADRSTLRLLRHVVRAQHEAALLILGSYRDVEVAPEHPLAGLLADLRRDRLFERVSLEGLDRSSVGALIASHAGQEAPSALVQTVHAQTEGNPFFVEEVVRDLIETGVVFERGGRWRSALEPDEIGVPEGIKEVLAHRLARLSENCRGVLSQAAVLGREFPFDLLSAMAETGEESVIGALEEALGARLVVEDEAKSGYAFTHALVRETLYGSISRPRRQRIHARAALAIEEAEGELAPGLEAHGGMSGDAGPELLADRAHHWYCAGDSRRALESAVEAGVAVDEIYAHAEALTQYERALELWDRVSHPEGLAGMDRIALRARASEAASCLGEPARAARMVEQALEEVDPAGDPVRAGLLRQRLGRYLWIAGDTTDALAAYQDAVRVIPDARASTERAQAIAALGHAQFISNRYEVARDLSVEGLEIARAVGAPVEEARALATLGAARASLGDRRDGLRMVLEGRALLERAGAAPELIFITYSYESLALAGSAEFEAAVLAVRPGIELMRRHGMHRSHQSWLEGLLASSLIKLGRWTEAGAILEAALLRGPTGITRRLVQLLRAELELARGDLAAATDTLADAREAARGDQPFTGKLFEVIAGLAMARGDVDSARSSIAQGLALLETLDDAQATAWLCWQGLRGEADRAQRARAGKRASDAEAAMTIAGRLLERIRAFALPETARSGAEIPVLLLGCEAESARAAGGPAANGWLDAADGWASLREPYPRAYCLMQAAQAGLSEFRSRADIAASLNTAHQLADDLDAAPLLAAIESIARRGSVRIAARDV